MRTVGKFHILLTEVEFQLHQAGKVEELLAQLLKPLRIASTQLTDCQSMLSRSHRVDKVGHSLCLREVQTTIEESPTGEFSWFRKTGAIINQNLQEGLLDIKRTVTRNLNSGFPGVAFRVEQGDNVVEVIKSTINGAAR